MYLERVVIGDYRSVWGSPLELGLGRDVTAVVGPNGVGKSNLVRALACAVDPGLGYDPARDRPLRRPDAASSVTLHFRCREAGSQRRVATEVLWLGKDRTERVDPDDDRAAVPVGPGRVLYVPAGASLAELVARHRGQLGEPAEVAEAILRSLRRVLSGVDRVTVAPDAVEVLDTGGFPLGPDAGTRVVGAIGLACHLADRGVELACTVVEAPEAWLHPAAQEVVRDLLGEVAVRTDAPVVVTAESPFVVPRSPDSRVVAVGQDRIGTTRVVGVARGDEPHAPLLGGLFRDVGLAAVLDRTGRIPSAADGVLIVEGGTDEAYLRLAADRLGRTALLDRIAVHPGGGAMAAALQAIVLRAETDLPLLVLLDNDDPGRRAKHTLTDRFGFANRREVVTYAEVVPDQPVGTEAEDLFRPGFVRRFVDEQGPASIRGTRILRGDEWHYDLTASAKSAFVGWAEEQAEPGHLERWSALLDLVADRLGVV